VFIGTEIGSLTEPVTGRRWDPNEIRSRTLRREAQFRALGFRRGDRAFLHQGNALEFFVDLLAVWTIGGCVIPIDGRLTLHEIEVLTGAARPRLSLWRGEADRQAADQLAGAGVTVVDEGTSAEPQPGGVEDVSVPPSLEDEALILFTSGTTGDPKGVVHTHRTLRARWFGLRGPLGVRRYRRTLCLLPTHFGHGLICNCLYPWLSGQDLYVLPPFRADLVLQLGALLDEHRITFMSSVPALWRLALRTAPPPRAGTLERVSCGSAPLSAGLWEGIREWVGTQEVLNTYGITETGSWVAGTTIPELIPRDGLIGVPWGAELKILDSMDTAVPPWRAEACAPGEEGYVWLNTPALMKGYLDREDLTRGVVNHGWFVTGDIGVLEDGLFFLRGRAREEINKGGMKVHPGDVDAVVESFRETTDVCTFGYEDPLYGEEVGIAVVLEKRDPETIAELRSWVEARIARHKVPQRWHLLDAIPRTTRGKINREEVARACSVLEPMDTHV
jgi:acyl-CoA synthetase (AMP-forming)/AMP-acid ligase II